jgi:hypothetical protein
MAGSCSRAWNAPAPAEPAQLDAGEIIDKGFDNRVAVQDRHTGSIPLLSAAAGPPRITVDRVGGHTTRRLARPHFSGRI